ncbi:cell adhesion molecule DSCAM-like [Dysidea avara]|uniref:cell adhesion molecule DSCAM-like n=1 Tax=Dysidea avara TaxID=196820 RepID=UPI003334344B
MYMSPDLPLVHNTLLQVTTGSPPPLIVMISNPLIHLQTINQTSSMKCISDAKGVNYTWEKRYSTLPSRAQGVNTSNMIIVNIKPEDSGEYRCIISNSIGRLFSKYESLTVKVIPPKVVRQPFSVVVNFSSMIIFKCSGKGYRQTKVTWHKDGLLRLPTSAVATVSESSNDINGTLKVYGVIGHYKGYYYCSISNTAGRVNSMRAYLNITVPHPEIVRPPHSVSLRPGKSAFFECLAWSYSGLVYDWYKRTTNISTNSVISYNRWSENGSCISTIYTLSISNIQLSDEGLYCCVATNDYGSVEECAWLEVNTTANITCHPSSSTYRAMEEKLSALKCEAEGIGPISYKWEKYQPSNDSWIRPSDRVVNITSTKLIFTVIMEEDEGIYHCVVTNDDGSVVSDNATITVYGPPTINFISNPQLTVEGDKTSLTCNATNDEDAVDSLQILWYKTKDNVPITGQQDVVEKSKISNLTTELQSTISFNPISHNDDGEYTCRAFNHPQSYNESKTNVTVEFAPTVTIDPALSPLIKYVNDNLRLFCTAKGLPVPKILWYEGNTPINQPFPHYFLVPTKSPHTTNYTCVATNNAGGKRRQTSVTITVIIKEKVCPCPANGQVFLLRDGKTFVVNCNFGHNLVGPALVTCSDEKWMPQEPKCVPAESLL